MLDIKKIFGEYNKNVQFRYAFFFVKLYINVNYYF